MAKFFNFKLPHSLTWFVYVNFM